MPTLKQARQKPNNIGELVTTLAPAPNIPALIPRELPGLAQATLGPAPPVWTTGYDSVKQFYRPGTSQQRFPPLPTKSNPQINAQAASVAKTVVTAALAAQTMGVVADDEEILTNVQTGASYTALLSDRNTLISMTDNSGGTVTLPGSTNAFAYVQTVYGLANSVGSIQLNITNTLGNAMFAISESTTGSTATIGDTNGNTWTFICAANGMFYWYATNIKSGANIVKVVQPPGNTSVLEVNLVVHEFSGILPGGIDSFGDAVGASSLTVHFPNTVAIGAFRYDLTFASTNPMSPGAGYTQMPPLGTLVWQDPAGNPPNLYVIPLDEYQFNPPLGVLAVNIIGSGGYNESSFGSVAANFQTMSLPGSVMPAGWYTYVENTGTGVYVVQSRASIDGANQTIILQPNTGVLIVSNGVSYRTERGVATSVLLETNGTPNLSQTVLNLVQGTNILLTNTLGGSVRIDATGGSSLPYVMGGFIAGAYGTSQDLMSIPVDRLIAFVANFGVNTDGSQSEATLQTAATASTVFIINKVVSGTPTQIGTITFAISGTVGTFASTGGAGQTLNAGDVMQVLAPASADATAAGLGFTLSGTR